MAMHAPRTFLPVLATVAGIAVFSAMDAVMKGASIAAGVYTAVFLRNTMGAAMMVPVWLAAGRPMAGRAAFRVHVQRAVVTSGMAMLFFYSLTLLPLAEAIALSFIAPLIALYLAALCVLAGSLFGLLAAIGILRLPDLLTRMHAASKAGLVGAGLIMVGIAIASGESAIVLRAVLGTLFLALTTPVSAHLLARAAIKSGDAAINSKDRNIVMP